MMLCEECNSHLILNKRKELECQNCGKVSEEESEKIIEELLHNEKENL